MSRLNTLMQLVTDTRYDDNFMAIPIPDPYTIVGVNSRNELIIVTSNNYGNITTRRAVLKAKVVQIVAGFSEIA